MRHIVVLRTGVSEIKLIDPAVNAAEIKVAGQQLGIAQNRPVAGGADQPGDRGADTLDRLGARNFLDVYAR